MYDGAPALGGADLTLELLVEFVVVLELDPDWYVVVAVDVYPPSIAVLDPDVLVCVDPAIADDVNNNSNNIESYFMLSFALSFAWITSKFNIHTMCINIILTYFFYFI